LALLSLRDVRTCGAGSGEVRRVAGGAGEAKKRCGVKGDRVAGVVGLVCAEALLVWLALFGIGWGLPSEKRNELTFGVERGLWRAPRVDEETGEDPWGRYPNFVKGGRERTGEFPRSAFNPVRSYHPDEYAVLKSLSGMRPSRLDFDPGFSGWPAFHIYVVGGALKAASLVGGVKLVPKMDFYFQRPGEMARLYVVGRLVTLLFAVCCVAAVWRAARRLFGGMGAAAAALVLAAMPLFTVNAHYLTADVPMLFWIAMTLWMCTHVLKGGGRRWYVVAGVFLGLAAGTRYQGALAAFLIVAAHVLRERGSEAGALLGVKGRVKDVLCSRELWLAAGVSVGMFLVVNPYIVLRPVRFVTELSGELSGSRSGGPFWRDVLLFALTGMGPVLTICFGGAFAAALARRERAAMFVVIGFGVPAVLLLAGRPVMARYMMPAMLLAPLTVGWVLGRIHEQGMMKGKEEATFAVPFVLILLVGATGAQSWLMGRLYSDARYDTRTRAGEWIARRVPAGATVGVVSVPWQFELPPMNEGKYRVEVLDVERMDWEGGLPEYVVTSDLQFPPVGVGGPLSEAGRGFWSEVFRGGKRYRVLRRFEAWPYGLGAILRYGPHDMRYANPEIVVAVRRRR